PGAQRGNDAKGQKLQDTVATDLAHALMWKAVLDFGRPEDVSRRQLLERFERILRLFPDSQHVPRARATAEMLRRMLKEDGEYATKRKAGKPFDRLTKAEQIADLIFRLSDQFGRQWGEPGGVEIFDFKGGPGNTPADQLVQYGYDAVPQLLA